MFRLILIIAIIYLALKVIKAWKLFQMSASARRPVGDQETGRIDDVMVKDPYCQVYFPKRKGIRIIENGEELFFCSHECRNKYAETHLKNK